MAQDHEILVILADKPLCYGGKHFQGEDLIRFLLVHHNSLTPWTLRL